MLLYLCMPYLCTKVQPLCMQRKHTCVRKQTTCMCTQAYMCKETDNMHVHLSLGTCASVCLKKSVN